MIDFINLYLVPALAIGSVYALGAVGISMIFGILRFAHFAHGDLMTLGAYGVLGAATLVAVNPLLVVPVGMALAVASALLIDRVFYRPLRKLPTIYTVIASFGVALIIRSLLQLMAGSENKVFVAGVRPPLVLFDTFRISLLHAEAIAATAIGLEAALGAFAAGLILSNSRHSHAIETAVKPVVETEPRIRGMAMVVPPLKVSVTSGATRNFRTKTTATPLAATTTCAVPRSKTSGTSTVTLRPSM